MAYELEGVLYKKFDTENKSDTFQARDFVVQTDGNYPQLIKFQLTQDRCAAVDPFNENEKIKVFFDLRGREWNGKYFTNLNAWKIEKPQAQESIPASMPTEEPPFSNFAEEGDGSSTEEIDLPF